MEAYGSIWVHTDAYGGLGNLFSGPTVLGGKPQKTIKSPDRLYKAPKDNTKPRQTLQSPTKTTQSSRRLYKAPEDYTKPQKDNTKPQNTIQALTDCTKPPKY